MANHNKYHNGQLPSNDSFRSALNQDNDQEEEGLNLKQLFYSLWNNKWLVIGAIVFFTFLAGVITLFMAPVYQSNGTILITASQNRPTLGLGSSQLGQLISNSYGFGAGSTISNELQILKSRRLSKMVADSLLEQPIMQNGRMYPVLFNGYPNDSTLAFQDTVAARLRKKLLITQVDRNADVISIAYDSPSPVEAADVVSITMDQYKQLSTSQSRNSAQSAASFLEKERQRIKDELREAEERLREFMNNSDLVEVDAQTRQIIERLSQMEAQRQEVKAKLVAVESAIDKYESQLNEIKPGLADQYANAIAPNLNRLQFQLAEFQIQKMQLTTNNPKLEENPNEKIRNLNEKIENYQSKIRELTNNVLNRSDNYIGFLGGEGVAENVNDINKKLIELKVQNNQFQAQTEILTEQINQQQAFFNNLPDNIIELARLKRDVAINEELYKTVSQQYAETSLAEQTQFGNGRVIDIAFIPQKPYYPNILLFLIAGFVFGGIVGVGYVLGREIFSEKIDGIEELRSLPVPVLAVIPTMNRLKKQNGEKGVGKLSGGKTISPGLVTILQSQSHVSEAYRKLQNNVIYSNPDKKLNSMLFTSAGKEEGKTTTIANLGVVLAEAGYRTLLVDIDLRRPNLHNMFDINQLPGIVEAVYDDIKLEQTLSETVVPELYVMPAGRSISNPSALMQSGVFSNLLADLESQFDFLLIDTPPIGIISDAAPLMRKTDGVVVVARFKNTTEPQLHSTLEQLQRIHANVLGTVLTDFDHTQSTDVRYGRNFYQEVYQQQEAYKRAGG